MVAIIDNLTIDNGTFGMRVVWEEGRIIEREQTGRMGRNGKRHDHSPSGDLEQAVADFVGRYIHHRHHESLDNLAPADVYFGRCRPLPDTRKEI